MRKILTILLIIMMSTVFVGCKQEKTVDIGVIGTLTGMGSYFGQQEVKGLEVAKEIINSEGGINGKKINLIVEDSQTKSDLTVSAFYKLHNLDGVKFIIGDSWNGNTEALVPLLEEKVLAFSPAAALSSLSKDDLFFRTVPQIKDMSYTLADYTYNSGIRKVAIVSCTVSFCTEHTNYFTEKFEELGGKVVEVQKIQLGQADVKTELIKIKEKNPEAIFIPISSVGMVNPLKQIKEFGLNVTILGGFGTESATLIQEHYEISKGVFYPHFYDENFETKESLKFRNAYKTKYGSYPDATAINSYDALMIIADAISHVGEDPIKVKEYILNKEYNLAGGNLSFDENGDVKKTIFIKTIKDRKFVKIN